MEKIFITVLSEDQCNTLIHLNKKLSKGSFEDKLMFLTFYLIRTSSGNDLEKNLVMTSVKENDNKSKKILKATSFYSEADVFFRKHLFLVSRDFSNTLRRYLREIRSFGGQTDILEDESFIETLIFLNLL